MRDALTVLEGVAGKDRRAWIAGVGLCLVLGGALAAPAAAVPVWGGSHAGVGDTARPAAAAAPPSIADSPALRALMSATFGRDDAGFAFRPWEGGGGGGVVAVRGGAVAAVRDGGFAVATGGHRWVLSPAAIGRRGRLARWGAGAGAGGGGGARTVANRVEFAGDDAVAWFVNGPLGLEQGWTIARRPAGRGDLRLALTAGGDLRAVVSADRRDVDLIAATGEAVFRYAGLAAYDARGRQLAARFGVDGGELLMRVADAGAIYPLTVDPFIQVAKLAASDGAAKDALGSALAVSGDGATIVAGAPAASIVGHASQGAVYVFSRPAAGWASGTQVAKLTATDGGAGDQLGAYPYGVAVSADGTTVAAGAPYATAAGHSEQGAVYVFVRPGATWASETQKAKLSASDGAPGDQLKGVSVSGDGSTIVAGSAQATIAGRAAQGAVYVFERPAAGWASAAQAAKLTASDGAAEDGFGFVVAVSADGSTLATGAFATIAGRSSQGAVYVFAKPGSGWANGTQTAKLTAADGAVDDDLGFGIAISGDGSTVVAGADGATLDGREAQGAAYVFVRPGGTWTNATQTAKLIASDGARLDELGTAVAVSADGALVVAGSRFATIAGHSEQGAAYVFARPAVGWADATETVKLTAADGGAGDEMGVVVVSGDGATIAAGAFFATVAGRVQQGAVYVFDTRCAAGGATLCLDDQPGDGRWQVTADFSTTEGGGHAGSGQAIPLASLGVAHGGLFWFFDATNPEMLLKVLDGCAVNQQFWVFSSATTNVGFNLTVTDTHNGRNKVYTNKDGTAAVPVQDTSAFACTDGDAGPAASGAGSATPERAEPTAPALTPAPTAVATAACASTATTLCIGGRFEVKVHYHTAQDGGSTGSGQAIGLESLGVAQGGLFWFFAADNPEMLVKVLDACTVNDRFWIFYAAGTNVAFTVTVADTQTGQVRTYQNADLHAAPPVQDTNALPCP